MQLKIIPNRVTGAKDEKNTWYGSTIITRFWRHGIVYVANNCKFNFEKEH